MADSPKLFYFDGRGKAEFIRLALTAAGIKFSEEFLSERSQMVALLNDDKLMYNQVPMLEIDGRRICQSNAIVRYIARKADLNGKNEDETVLVEQVFEGGRDFYNPCMPIGFRPEEEVLNELKTKTIPKYLPLFEKIAAKNGTGYMVGDAMTIADVSVLEPLLVYTEYFGKEILNEYPALTKFYDTMTAEPKMDAYLKGPQRKRKNDELYVTTARRVLAF